MNDIEETFSQGSCHIFAAACVLTHGGTFLVATDSGSTHYENEDGDYVDEVIHVLAEIPLPGGGHVIRDVFGDRTIPPGGGWTDLRKEISERYGVWERDVSLTVMTSNEMSEIVQDEDGFFRMTFSADDQWALIEDHDLRPLEEMTSGSLAEAMALEEVRAGPGERPMSETSGMSPE